MPGLSGCTGYVEKNVLLLGEVFRPQNLRRGRFNRNIDFPVRHLHRYVGPCWLAIYRVYLQSRCLC